MTTLTLTVTQLKEIFLAGATSEGDVFLFESLALKVQEYINEGVSVHSKEYAHMTDIIEMLDI